VYTYIFPYTLSHSNRRAAHFLNALEKATISAIDSQSLQMAMFSPFPISTLEIPSFIKRRLADAEITEKTVT